MRMLGKVKKSFCIAILFVPACADVSIKMQGTPTLEPINLSETEQLDLIEAPKLWMNLEPTGSLASAISNSDVSEVRAERVTDNNVKTAQGWIVYEPTGGKSHMVFCFSESTDPLRWLHCQEYRSSGCEYGAPNKAIHDDAQDDARM